MAKTFLITPGELDSIGLEVTLKSLSRLNPIKTKSIYIFYTSQALLEKHLKVLDLKINLSEIEKPSSKLDPGCYYIINNNSPISWFEDAISFCNKNANTAALVTGPLKKASFKESKSLGHTDFLRKKFKTHTLFMTFFGEHYNCLLLNDHIPLKEASEYTTLEVLEKALTALDLFDLKTKIALLGVNPHAGEEGLLGNIEIDVHKKFVGKHINKVSGPLPADGFFSIDDYKKYPFIIANYHDQGLIPFKLIHGFKGSQATLGLPFIRTSVDHGTADGLFLKSKANSESMTEALNLAHKLLILKAEVNNDL